MILGENGKSPYINYPCDWRFTIIGSDPEEIEKAVIDIVEEYNYTFSPAKSSKKGKYYSFHLVVEVPTEEIRIRIFNQLENQKAIKIVL